MLTTEEVQSLSRASWWRPTAVLITDWAIILGLFTVAAYFDHVVVYVLCALLMARQQLALAVLMHDAAHKRLYANPTVNDWVTQLFVAGPIYFSLNAYRSTHMVHHRAPLTDEDPDLRLTGGFPISRASFARKLLRDLIGISSIKFFMHFLRAPAKLKTDGAQRTHRTGPSSTVVIASIILPTVGVFTLLTLAGHPWLYLLWALPPLTILQVLLRIRGVAEHAGYAPGPDQARCTRTIVNPLECFFFAPHGVHYHIEHHLYPTVPFYRLPAVHRLMAARGALPAENVSASYFTMLRGLPTPT